MMAGRKDWLGKPQRASARCAMLLLGAATVWVGCFYGVADLASGSGGTSSAGGALGGTGDGGVTSGSGAGAAPCAGVDLDCEFRQRCSDAALVPRVFIGAQAGPYAVLADKNTVFWSDRDAAAPGAGRIRRRDVSGGPTLDLALNQLDPGVLALDSRFIYWVSAPGAVSRVARDPSDAGLPELDVIAADQHGPSGLAIDDGSVYWLSRGTSTIARRDKELPRGPVQVLAVSQPKPALLAQDLDHLYWTTGGGFVESVPKAGGTASELVTPTMLGDLLGNDGIVSFEAAGIALDLDWLYFRARGLRAAPAKDDTGKLLRVHKDGSRLSLLVGNRAGGIAQLWLDGSKLYFTTGSTGGEVWRVGSDGSGLVLLNCQAEAFPNGITTAGNRAYWTNLTGATLIWAPK